MNRFDIAKATIKTVEGKKLKARLIPGTHIVTASIEWKPGHRGVPGVTGTTEESVMANLRLLDDSIRLYRRATEDYTGNISKQDDNMLEGLRTDPEVSNAGYLSACRKLNQTAKPRPDFTQANQPDMTAFEIVPLSKQQENFKFLWQIHPELAEGGHGQYNFTVIEQWLAAENLQATMPNLERAYAEIKANSMFRDRTSGTRGARIVMPFNMNAIRKRRIVEVDPDAPKVSTVVARQKEIEEERQDVFRRARTEVLAQRPDLKPEPGKSDSGELNQLIDQILLQEARRSNSRIGQSNKRAVDPIRNPLISVL